MAIVTGSVDDFGPAGISAADGVTLSFIPSGPAIQQPPQGQGSSVLLLSRKVDVIPAADRSFAVDLVPTVDVQPSSWYAISLHWLNGAGIPVGADFPDWRLYVPEEGGDLSDLMSVPANPVWVWTGTEPPTNPTPGTWWLNPETGDLNEWSN